MSSEQFHKITLGNPPRELAKEILPHLNNNSLILDCGCGVGNDTLFFISQGHKVIALDSKTNILENRLKDLTDINENVTVRQTDIVDFEIPKIDCFYSSLTLSFLSRKNFYSVWNKKINGLDKETIIGINIFGDRDDWYRDTDDMTFMKKEEFKFLFSNFQILYFLEKERLGTSMGKDGLPRSKKWHVFECIAKI